VYREEPATEDPPGARPVPPTVEVVDVGYDTGSMEYPASQENVADHATEHDPGDGEEELEEELEFTELDDGSDPLATDDDAGGDGVELLSLEALIDRETAGIDLVEPAADGDAAEPSDDEP